MADNAVYQAVLDRLTLDDEVATAHKKWIDQTVTDTTDELKILMETTDIPTEYNFIIIGVVVKRYNRRKNEGMEGYSEGETRVTYERDDFAQYDRMIQKYLRENELGNRNAVRIF